MGDKWNGWKITAEQAKAIKDGDIEARNRFYIDNLPRIQKMARNYQYRNPRCKGLYPDMVQGVYIDLPLFDFVSGAAISVCLYRSFSFCPLGGYLYVKKYNSKLLYKEIYLPAKVLSLDKPVNVQSRSGDDISEKISFVDSILSSPSPEDDIINDEEITPEMLGNIVFPYLSKQEKEVFLRLMDGYKFADISEYIGVKNIGQQYTRICNKLRINYLAVLEALEAMGVVIPTYAKEKPAGYDKAIQEKEKRNARNRDYQAKRKALKVATMGNAKA